MQGFWGSAFHRLNTGATSVLNVVRFVSDTCSQLRSFFFFILEGFTILKNSIEKQAYAFIKFLRKWRHFLLSHHFQIVID